MAMTQLGEQKKLSFKEKFAYATGTLPSGFFSSFTGAITTFYYAWMGLKADYILIGQLIYMVWNVLNDPIFGTLQDRTRTKMGRYLPWIKYSAVPFTIGFILLFIPPQGWRLQTGGEKYQIALLIWYVVSYMIYDTFFTIVYLAHVSLAPQMTFDQKERTEINGLGSILTFVGMGASLAFPMMYLTNPTSTKIAEFQLMAIIFGILALIPWIFIVKVVKEKKELIPKDETPFWEGVKYVFKNKSGLLYMVYDGMSVGILNSLLTGMFFMFSWIFGAINLNPGSNAMLYFIIPALFAVIGIPIQLKIGSKISVKAALSYSLWTIAIGGFISYIGIMTSDLTSSTTIWEVPSNIWLVSIGMAITFLGFSGDFIFHQVMRADTIDYDELQTGERREAVYAGIACLFGKVMESVVFALIPAFLALYGLVPSNPEDPTAEPITPTLGIGNAIKGVATGVFLMPAIFALIGAILWFWYPLGKEHIAEMRIKLEELHAQKRADRL
ncbi:MFS transporter [Candidatus Lokiarchaeum ossiferum]|uniref:MFS transporter n=1 Tax=Candidatus Lokiarchaeum ossiferum TaxID=2951803 RepID=UPI00352C7A9C